MIDHTIQWARDYFEGEFTDGANEVTRFLKNPQEFLNKLETDLLDKLSLKRSKYEQL